MLENHEICPYLRTHNCIWFPGFLDGCPRSTVQNVENIFLQTLGAGRPKRQGPAGESAAGRSARAGPHSADPWRRPWQPASTDLRVTGHTGPAEAPYLKTKLKKKIFSFDGLKRLNKTTTNIISSQISLQDITPPPHYKTAL